MKVIGLRCIALSAVSFLLSSIPAFADQLTIAFVDRAGYSYMEDGKPKGFLIDIAKNISAKARIDFAFQAIPQARAISMLQEKTPNFCLLGLFKNPEREEFSVFTKPIYKNQPMGVLTMASKAPKFSKFSTLADLLNAPDMTLSVVTGFSYGKTIDDMVEKMKGKKDRAAVTPAQMLAMMAADRFDYMFADPEEYKALAQAAKVDEASIKMLAFPDIPEGNQRYLLCSKAVPAATIDQLNAAIGP
jgi:uncharacterized protein (TIGR02285 family)